VKVAVIIVHFLDQKLTQRCLESISHLKLKNIELQVHLVNNNPLENLTGLKRKSQKPEGFKKIGWLATGVNLGFTGGYNFGIKAALRDDPDWVLLLNNDTVLDKNLIVNLIKAVKKNPQAGIMAPKILFSPGYEYHQDRYQPSQRGKVIWFAGGVIDWHNVLASHRGVDEVDQGQYDQTMETDFVSGCAMMIKVDLIKNVGFLDDRYFLYLEDLEYCQRAKKAGYEVIYYPRAKLWHANAGSSEVGGSLHDYYFTRNRLLFGLQYAPWRAKIALVRESLRLLISGRKWQKQGVKDFYARKFGKGSWHD
jgi:GT2 family glycosyltransferase